jgi:biotin-(acetyl-CoA carboxylase) ligase
VAGQGRGNGPIEGVALGLDRDGALLVRRPDGVVERVIAGDVEVRGMLPG